jgi:hypothetical protein
MQAIIYKKDQGGVAVIWPTPQAVELYGIEAIALKDIPHGKPFKIVNVEDLPTDGTMNEQGIPNIDKRFREQWTVDEADLTDGIGADYSSFPEAENAD